MKKLKGDIEITKGNIFRKEKGLRSGKVLLCPKCYETLTILDIEHFKRCPYCDTKIYIDNEVEDYILTPIIDKWVNMQNSNNSIINEGVNFLHDLLNKSE